MHCTTDLSHSSEIISQTSPTWLGLLFVGLACVVGLVIALAKGRGRVVLSALLTLGLMLSFLVGLCSWSLQPTSTAELEANRKHALAEVVLERELATQIALAELSNKPDAPDELPVPLEPPADTKDAKAESDEADTDEKEASGDASSAPDKSTSAEEVKADQPPPDDNRPDWVGAKPFKDGAVYKVPVTVGPWPTSKDAIKLLPAAVDVEIARYAVSRTGDEAAASLKLPPDYVMAHMIQEDVWEEPLKIDSFDDVKHMVGRDVWENAENAADGQWSQLHVLVKFDRDVNQRLDHAWAGQFRVKRLQATGLLGGILMILLGAVYASLKIDLKTGGAYRGRCLRVGAGAAILGALVALLAAIVAHS